MSPPPVLVAPLRVSCDPRHELRRPTKTKMRNVLGGCGAFRAGAMENPMRGETFERCAAPHVRHARRERRIHEPEAAVVRRIFQLSAGGEGYTRIAKLLNSESIPSARTHAGSRFGWAPTSVKGVLEQRLYLGEVIWNRSRKRDRWGQRRQSKRSATDWMLIARPELQMVSRAEWQAARARLERVRTQLQSSADGQLRRRHARDVDSRFLLSGLRAAPSAVVHSVR